MNIYIYEETTSTNDLAKQPEFRHSDAIWAHHQSAGRGQRGNTWSGGVGVNIAFTVVLEPQGVVASDQFLISQIAALALHEAMEEYGIGSKIKWTNDIYVDDRKMAGILIENSLRDGMLTRSVVGIGLNINQLEFDPSLPNPTSMTRVTGKTFDREEVLRNIHRYLMLWFDKIASGDVESIRKRYSQLLYRKDELHTYRLASGELFDATIESVAPQGELMLRDTNKRTKGYLFREVEFVIAGRDK
ncbi:MAG: biotin--[acetyl-CoA-carboxylase] ligase [Rikenellaceae bacterium]